MNAGRCLDLPEALPLDSAKGAQPLWKPILFQIGWVCVLIELLFIPRPQDGGYMKYFLDLDHAAGRG